MQVLIGRSEEQARLKRLLTSRKSEFIVLCGRRRVGKTFLVKTVFQNSFAFYATGIQDSDPREQLRNFNKEIANHGGASLEEAASWREAFENLNKLIAAKPQGGKKVVFLDEISWMGSSDTQFLTALDHFWNRWASSRDDVILIVCGSATSWIINNIVNDTGGLHNRLTDQIRLAPFTLKECEEYFKAAGTPLPRYQTLEFYMVFGGIPYYMDFYQGDRSPAQNIDRLYFAPGAPLGNEYVNLYQALFKNPEKYISVVEALGSKKKGLTREELSDASKIRGGGTLTQILIDLINCGFVREYLAFGKKQKDRIYQLIDPFTLFHLSFAEKQKRHMENFWQQFSATPAHSAWSGYAFEQVCLLHVPEIKKALGISGVLTEVSSWRSKTSIPGAQIDLVLDRNDGIINLCEMKYSMGEYHLDKEYSKRLREKTAAFLTETKTRKAAHATLVTTYGLARNEYSAGILFQLTMEDLFART